MGTKLEKSALFLGKSNDNKTLVASEFIQKNFVTTEVHLGDWGESFPRSLSTWKGDYIFSYLSRWIVPAKLIQRTKVAAINFHPASPNYPGVGCNNFALYNNEKEFGVTCHFMLPTIDSGEIIATKKFPIYSTDNVSSLLDRTYDHQLDFFMEVIKKILNGVSLEPSGEKWEREPFTRKDLNRLSCITTEMDQEEISRRVRATNFGKWKPYIMIGNHKFKYTDES